MENKILNQEDYRNAQWIINSLEELLELEEAREILSRYMNCKDLDSAIGRVTDDCNTFVLERQKSLRDCLIKEGNVVKRVNGTGVSTTTTYYKINRINPEEDYFVCDTVTHSAGDSDVMYDISRNEIVYVSAFLTSYSGTLTTGEDVEKECKELMAKILSI